ncbi:MAG: MoaD/ThiS family protein [Flavobacteriales bacterium]
MEVLLFGILAEKAGSDRVEVQVTSIAQLRQAMAEQIPGLERIDHLIAVDRVVVHDDRPLNGREEIALLPPFAGG